MAGGDSKPRGEHEDLLVYRVDQLEEAVEAISRATDELRDFAVAIRVWIKVLAVAWSLIAAASVVFLAWVLNGGLGAQ